MYRISCKFWMLPDAKVCLASSLFRHAANDVPNYVKQALNVTGQHRDLDELAQCSDKLLTLVECSAQLRHWLGTHWLTLVHVLHISTRHVSPKAMTSEGPERPWPLSWSTKPPAVIVK